MVHIDNAILLLISVEPAKQIDKRPGIIAANVSSLRQRLFQSANMAAQVVDSRIVDHLTGNNRVFRSQAILGDIDRDIAIARLDHHNAVG